jgi:hypothetical protein
MTTYTDYRENLRQLQVLPESLIKDLARADRARDEAVALADKAVTDAKAVQAATTEFVTAQLSTARGVLEPVGRSNLVPPTVKPSLAKQTSVTRTDVSQAQQRLAASVNTLRQAVQAEARRQESEAERAAREAAERERLAREATARAAAAAARRQKLTRAIAIGLTALLLLVLVLLVAS